MSKFIVIDGMDGSGKHTQASMLRERLSKMTADNVYLLSFPRYGEISESLVELYLHGHINKDPMQVNPYASAMCYALDRYISYERYWKLWTEFESIIIFDRYVSSNALHQSPKLPPEERQNFISWVYDIEYKLFGLPVPDIEIFLDVPAKKSVELITGRYNGDESLKDIHENESFQHICHKCFEEGKDTYFSNMKVIDCTTDKGELRSISDINDDIIDMLRIYDIIY